jgi:hypothetical protein
VVGGVLGGLVLHDQSVTKSDDCNATTHTCNSSTGLSAASQGRTLGPATTVALVVGGVGVATGVVWLLARPSAKPSATTGSLGLGASWTGNGGAWRLQGSW